MSVNTPPRRYLAHLQKFDTALRQSLQERQRERLEPLGKILYTNDGRTPFFQLQGLARIEAKSGKNKKDGDAWLAEFKKIEDALGQYDYWMAMVKNNERWKFPDVVQQYFEREASFYLGVLEERLIQQGWIQRDLEGYHYANQAMKRIEKSLKAADWYGSAKEARKLAAFFRDEAMEIQQKIESREIDLAHLEEGIHEFRRKVRWLSIYASALLGKVRFSKADDKDKLAHFITPERSIQKFNQLPVDPTEENPVKFLRGGFYALGDIINDIGKLKDAGLATQEIETLGKMFGLRPAQIKQHLGPDYAPHPHVVKAAAELIEKLATKDRTLIHVADFFDKQV